MDTNVPVYNELDYYHSKRFHSFNIYRYIISKHERNDNTLKTLSEITFGITYVTKTHLFTIQGLSLNTLVSVNHCSLVAVLPAFL